jgi:hypothetical protein
MWAFTPRSYNLRLRNMKRRKVSRISKTNIVKSCVNFFARAKICFFSIVCIDESGIIWCTRRKIDISGRRDGLLILHGTKWNHQFVAKPARKTCYALILISRHVLLYTKGYNTGTGRENKQCRGTSTGGRHENTIVFAIRTKVKQKWLCYL